MTKGVAEAVAGIRQASSYCVAFVLCAAVLSASADDHTVQAPSVFPAESWDVSSPRLAGMDESLLEEARDYTLAGGGSGLIGATVGSLAVNCLRGCIDFTKQPERDVRYA